MHKLPFDLNLDDIDILKALSNANNKIGELNGLVKALQNPNIILNAVILCEAKESSEIENIVTTYDRIFKEIILKTKNEYLRNNLNISRNTASKYLHSLSKIGILIEEKVGKEIIYKNSYLYDLIKTW